MNTPLFSEPFIKLIETGKTPQGRIIIEFRTNLADSQLLYNGLTVREVYEGMKQYLAENGYKLVWERDNHE